MKSIFACMGTTLFLFAITGHAGQPILESAKKAAYSQGMIEGKVVRDSSLTYISGGVTYQNTLRVIKVMRWIRYPFSSTPPDSILIPIEPGRPGALDSLVMDQAYFLHLEEIMDSFYPFRVRYVSLLASAQGQLDLRIAEKLMKTRLLFGWGIVEDTVTAAIGKDGIFRADTAIFLNLTNQNLFLNGAMGEAECPNSWPVTAQFYSTDISGQSIFHAVSGGSITPPLEVSWQGAVLITQLQLNAETCVAGEDKGRLMFNRGGENDTVGYRGPLETPLMIGMLPGNAQRRNRARMGRALMEESQAVRAYDANGKVFSVKPAGSLVSGGFGWRTPVGIGDSPIQVTGNR